MLLADHIPDAVEQFFGLLWGVGMGRIEAMDFGLTRAAAWKASRIIRNYSAFDCGIFQSKPR